jgi:hypothetical protein
MIPDSIASRKDCHMLTTHLTEIVLQRMHTGSLIGSYFRPGRCSYDTTAGRQGKRRPVCNPPFRLAAGGKLLEMLE